MPLAVSTFSSSPQSNHVGQGLRGIRDLERIDERPSESFKPDLHKIAVFQLDSLAVAQTIGAEVMHVDITRAAMCFVLEMMVLDIREAMAHFRFARANLFRPENLSGTADGNLPNDGVERRIEYEFGAERTGAQF